MKIKIGDLTKRQISKICLQTVCAWFDECICPLYNKSKHCCMVGSPYMDVYDDLEVDIPEDI